VLRRVIPAQFGFASAMNKIMTNFRTQIDRLMKVFFSIGKNSLGGLLMKKTMVLLALVCSCNAYSQKYNGLALTPPMGWSIWNTFKGNINEQLIHEAADAMVSSGMRDAGYRYINKDDEWQGGRDSMGFVYADPVKFPSGMKALADYIHSKGLKIGIYSDPGALTCEGVIGNRGHEYQDALMYAKWGFDLLKYDWCNTDSLNAYWSYSTMRDAIYAAGRPMIFYLCKWGNNSPWNWGKDVGTCGVTAEILHRVSTAKSITGLIPIGES
jgi:Alpha galactosidase A